MVDGIELGSQLTNPFYINLNKKSNILETPFIKRYGKEIGVVRTFNVFCQV